jgi:hypothetical protein
LLAAIPATVNSFADVPDGLPAYLIELQGRLSLDGTTLTQTNALTLGRTLYATQIIKRPDGQLTQQKWGAFVGESRALGMAYHGGHAGSLNRYTDSLIAAQSALSANNSALGSNFSNALLALAGDAHFASSDAYQAWLAGPNRVVFYRAPSANTSYAALDVAAPLGIITTAYLAGAGVSDVSPNHFGANLTKGNPPAPILPKQNRSDQARHLTNWRKLCTNTIGQCYLMLTQIADRPLQRFARRVA